MKQRIVSILLGLTLIFTLLPQMTLSAHAEVYSGTCGTNGSNLTWTLDTATGVLNISGKGEMMDYNDFNDIYAPWSQYDSEICTVRIGNGVASIGASAFYSMTSIKHVTISDSVKRIGRDAFFYCDSLREIEIPRSVTNIGDQAFSYCN